MSFRDDVLKILRKGQGSLYGSIVALSRDRLPADAESRYMYLRSPEGRFIARDDADVDVYVSRVSSRHAPKFKWLYTNLFQTYPEVFSKDVDLVVWGCGCGLDLAAFYECAMEQKNPHLWTKVHHVTLIDASRAALQRAEELARVLFPLAINDIDSVICDLSKPSEIAQRVHLRQLNAYLPRVHLISNYLDLVSDAETFARAVKNSSKRVISHWEYYHEIIVAFSPEYRSGRVARNMTDFRKAWGTIYADPIKTVGDAPMNCEFCAFSYCTLAHIVQDGDRCFRSYMRGRNHALNMLVGHCPTMDAGIDIPVLATALSRQAIDGRNFFKAYRWVSVGWYRGMVERVVFIGDPSFSVKLRPCVIEIDRGGMAEVQMPERTRVRALKDLKDICGEMAYLSEAREDDFLVLAWNGSNLHPEERVDLSAIDTWRYVGNVDYSLAYRIDPGDAEPLPDLTEKMDETQRELIFSRAQYRKIRGGAGCGKSTTMMWHAVMTVLRTHLPVLLVCKTVTLFNRNAKRIAATLLKEVHGLEYVDANLIRFMTLDKILCEHSMTNLKKCPLKSCVRCQGCNHEPRINCKDYQDVGRQWRRLAEQEKNACCDVCVSDNIQLLARKNTKAAVGATAYGAVLIDEVQSVGPDLVQAVVNLTWGGNAARECYVFCDERQCLNPTAVEIDSEKGKLRVKVPDRGEGYGRWVDLNKPYRTQGEFTGKLTDVAVQIQSMTCEKYGAVELAHVIRRGQMELSNKSVFAIRKSTGDLMDDLLREIEAIHGDGSVTIICDTSETVRALRRRPESNGWLSTHCGNRSHAAEQSLRMNFREAEEGVQVTTVALAQGWDFRNVIYVCEVDPIQSQRNVFENALTGATRATSCMRVLDRSSSGWLYSALSNLNN